MSSVNTDERIASMGSVEANEQAQRLNEDGSIRYMGPSSNPREWSQAVTAARSVTIQAARLGRTITYGGLQIVVVEATRMKVGSRQYRDLAAEINDESDGCLLSSIVVEQIPVNRGPDFSLMRGVVASVRRCSPCSARYLNILPSRATASSRIAAERHCLRYRPLGLKLGELRTLEERSNCGNPRFRGQVG
jgi:hypothetical protein